MEPTQKSNGALIGSVIIVIILIIGGIYFWKTSMENFQPETPTEEQSGTNTSADLEAELNNIELESLDEEI